MKILFALLLGTLSVPAFALDNPDACPPGKVPVMGLCADQPNTPPPVRSTKPKQRHHRMNQDQRPVGPEAYSVQQ